MTESTVTAGINSPTHSSLGEQSKKFGDQSKKILADVQELGEIAKETASQAVDDLRERGTEALQSGRDRAVEAKRGVDRYIIAQPLKSVAIALGAGFLLGIIARR